MADAHLSTPIQPSTTPNTPTAEGCSVPGIYRRELPTGQIPFSSEEGRRIFVEALLGGTMAGYFKLAEQFHTQSEPAYCGLGTLAMILNALCVDPLKIWKGPWRWFSEDLLDCCLPLEVVKKSGITAKQFSCLAECNGSVCDTKYAQNSSEEMFRDAVVRCSTCENTVLAVSYLRSKLGQSGDGHFSPIGGYHRDRDLVLIMDVARFKYPPHWVPLKLLWEAMQPIDPATGSSRAYFILSKNLDFTHHHDQAAACTYTKSRQQQQTHAPIQTTEVAVPTSHKANCECRNDIPSISS